ncbi:hypothetical protein AAG906_014521 [Vitis piasezkii]
MEKDMASDTMGVIRSYSGHWVTLSKAPFTLGASLPAAFEVFKSSVQWVFVRSPQSWGFPYAGVLESFCNWVDEIKMSVGYAVYL